MFSATILPTGTGTWANEMNFVTNHASGVGSIARPVVQCVGPSHFD